ncbi:MAG: hypothetical protein MMC23_005595 [Stictis urceolatum]|nr:hypothetical protein [Stictis urceolata]
MTARSSGPGLSTHPVVILGNNWGADSYGRDIEECDWVDCVAITTTPNIFRDVWPNTSFLAVRSNFTGKLFKFKRQVNVYLRRFTPEKADQLRKGILGLFQPKNIVDFVGYSTQGGLQAYISTDVVHRVETRALRRNRWMQQDSSVTEETYQNICAHLLANQAIY